MVAEMIDWRPGVHDPTIAAWIVTTAYLLTALVCGRIWRVPSSSSKGTSLIWLLLAMFLLGLGINKQLDLQTLMIEVGRECSAKDSWFFLHRKRILDVVLIVTAGGVVVLASLGLRRLAESGWELAVAVTGYALILVMLCAQAVSYSPVSDALNHNLLGVTHEVLEVQVEEVLELSFLAVIAWAAWRYRGLLVRKSTI